MNGYVERFDVIKFAISHLGANVCTSLALVFSQVALRCCALTYSFLFKVLIDEIFANRSYSLAPCIFFSYCLLYCVESLLVISSKHATGKVFLQFSISIREKLWEKMMGSQYADLREYAPSDLKMRIDTDVDVLEAFVKVQILDFSANLLVATFTVILMISSNVHLSLLALLLLCMSFVISRGLEKGLAHHANVYRNLYSSCETWLYQTLSAWREIKCFSLYQSEERRYLIQWEEIAAAFLKRQVYQYGNYFLVALRDLLVARFSLYLVGSYYVYSGEMTVGNLVLFISYFELFSGILDEFVSMNIQWADSLASISRVRAMYFLKPRSHSPTIANITIFGVSQLTFRPQKSLVPLFSNMSFRIGPNQKIAVVGKSGCGKSTLLNLVIGDLLPDHGDVYFDSVVLTSANQREIIKKLGIVTQNPVLFNMTIKENLQMGNHDATDEEICDICMKVGLHEFVVSLNEGYRTVIGENGTRLSGGQRQSLALARVLLQNPEILLLDEATSALDHVTEKTSIDYIMNLNKTIFIVTHQLSIAKAADKILFIAEGGTISIGSFEDLQSNESFRKLFNLSTQRIGG